MTASVHELEVQARSLLLRFARTSTMSASPLGTSGHRRPTSTTPAGVAEHPAEAWAVRLERLPGTVGALEPFVSELADELEHVRRRSVGVELVAIGYSIRAAALLSGVARSTLHGRVQRGRA